MSLKNDTAYNFLGNGIPLLAAAGAIPYLLETIGAEKFGLLALIWALIGYFGLFDFGIGRALTYEVSRKVECGSIDAMRRLIKAGLVFTMFTGLIGALVVYFFVAPYSSTWFKLSSSVNSEARLAFEMTALAIIPTTLTSGLRGALEGFKRFLESNINRVALGTMMFVVPALIVMVKGADLPAVALGLVVIRYVICGLALFQLRQHLRGRFAIRSEDIKPLLNFGIWVTVSGIMSPLMVYGDRFFVSAAVGAQVLPLYAIPQEGLQRLLIIPAALTTALLPRMVAVAAKGDLITLYRQNLRRIAALMFPVLFLAAILAKPVLSIWISEEFAKKSILIVVILCVGLWFNSMAQMSMTLLHSVGRPKLAALAHMLELPLYVGLVILLSREFGIVGAAIAWSLRVMLDFFLFDHFAKMSLK